VLPKRFTVNRRAAVAVKAFQRDREVEMEAEAGGREEATLEEVERDAAVVKARPRERSGKQRSELRMTEDLRLFPRKLSVQKPIRLTP
jgi:hypothetical protein